MELLEKNQELTPYKLCLCILLYEALNNSRILPSDRTKILQFIITQIQNNQGKEVLYSTLIQELSQLSTDNTTESPKQLLEIKLSSMVDFSDVLQLFIVKLNELKSDGEISSGCLEQGGILYLFLRKCFVSFARMGFEDLVSLAKKLEKYKDHKPLQVNSRIAASEIAGKLEELVLNESYEGLTQRIGELNVHSKYLLQGHLDAYYEKNSSVDNIHRYFDLVLDQQMPTKTTREKGLVVVQSSTHFASLHRVKIELQLGHLEAAVHLLVETIKRALSENDNLVILESTLLFMKIASMMGNYKQEQRISQKAVMHALKIENIHALIKSTLFFSQLHLLYTQPNSHQIFSEITPKIETKSKPAMPVAKKLHLDDKVKTFNTLCDYTLLESLLSHEHEGLFKSLNFVQVMSWLNQGFDWSFSLYIDDLQDQFECTISEADFYLDLCRTISLHNRSKALDLLRFINSKCKEKKCIMWDYTLYYIAHIKSLQLGEFLEAEHFEEQAFKTQADEWKVKIMMLERYVQQKFLKSGFELANDLIEHFTIRGLNAELCICRLLLSQIFVYSNEHFRALSELNKCLEIVKDFACLEIPVKITLAETSLLAFESPLIALKLMNSVEEKIFNIASALYLGKFYKMKAKVLLALSAGIQESDDGEAGKKAFFYMEQAEEEFLKDNCLWELREVYYLQARAYDKIADYEARDFYAEKFCGVNKEINVNSKITYKKERPMSLDLLLD